MITEEKRQALIAFNQAIIAQHEAYAVPESRWPDDVRMLVDSARIALASLQSEPSHAMIDGDLVEVYPAPPVQVSDIVTFKTLPELEKWRSPEAVRAQAAYRQLIINMLESDK